MLDRCTDRRLTHSPHCLVFDDQFFKTAKKQLASILFINSQLKNASFAFALSLPASEHQNQLSSASTAGNRSPTQVTLNYPQASAP